VVCRRLIIGNMIMKLKDNRTRTIKVNIEYHEIVKMIIDNIRSEFKIEFTQFDDFNFSFIKEGSPEYDTRKIKCIVTKRS
jgi:hypothetical protein